MMKTHSAAFAAVIALAVMPAAHAAAAADARARLQGFWEPPLSGGTKMPERPVLTDKGKAVAEAMRAAQDIKDGVSVGSRYCLPLSQPWNLFQSAPIDIIQDDRETTMIYEGHSVPTHIYTDGRDHSGAAKLQAQNNGHAIGRWDGDAFVVDSVRFSPADRGSPSSALPGNVPKGETTHIVGRFIPSADGKTLVARFTADDPEILAKPYSWEFNWIRSDAGAYAAVGECDPRDLSNSKY